MELVNRYLNLPNKKIYKIENGEQWTCLRFKYESTSPMWNIGWKNTKSEEEKKEASVWANWSTNT